MDKYKRNYLTSVIARVDFTIPPAELDRDLPGALQDRIMEKFPTPADPVDCVETAISIRAGARIQTMEGRRYKRWDFYSRRKDKFVRVERDFFCIQYKKYKSFETLKADFGPLIKTFAQTYPDITYHRIGLRYVNTFVFPKEGPPLDWRQWIKKNLLVPLRVPRSNERKYICRAMQRLELNYGDLRLVFQYGIANPDYPSPVKQKQFVFDTDVFEEGLTEAADIMPKLEQFREVADKYFEDHITDEMRKHLNASRRK